MIQAHLLASQHLHARPELPTLAVLASALEAASAALTYAHPEHDWAPNPPGPAHLPVTECHIANSILVLAAELTAELDRYWAAAGGNQLELQFQKLAANWPT